MFALSHNLDPAASHIVQGECDTANGARGWSSDNVEGLIEGGFGRQNQLILVRLLCHGESGSGMFCGCGVAII
jgi:hypothetical protein